MIHLTAQTSILLATQPADFRCGIDGFVACCRNHLQTDPRSGTLFVFINRRKTMVRSLVYDGTGYWLMTKRLSKGRFKSWPKSAEALNPIAAKQLRQLLTGDHHDLPWQQVSDQIGAKSR